MNLPDQPRRHFSQKIGLLGGTFDPIHNGHLVPAISVSNWLALDQLFLLPAHIPPHKSTTFSSVEHRLSMVKLASQTQANLLVDDRELNRATPSYTVETLAEIKDEQSDSQLFFIIGMDSLLNFTTWHRWQDILALSHIVVTVRPQYSLESLSKQCHRSLHQYFCQDVTDISSLAGGKILFHQSPQLDISSTTIRQRIKDNANYQTLLPTPVYQYIEKHLLYR